MAASHRASNSPSNGPPHQSRLGRTAHRDHPLDRATPQWSLTSTKTAIGYSTWICATVGCTSMDAVGGTGRRPQLVGVGNMSSDGSTGTVDRGGTAPLSAAQAFMLGDVHHSPEHLKERDAIHRELERVLADDTIRSGRDGLCGRSAGTAGLGNDGFQPRSVSRAFPSQRTLTRGPRRPAPYGSRRRPAHPDAGRPRDLWTPFKGALLHRAFRVSAPGGGSTPRLPTCRRTRHAGTGRDRGSLRKLP